jgi:hypothetical protein
MPLRRSATRFFDARLLYTLRLGPEKDPLLTKNHSNAYGEKLQISEASVESRNQPRSAPTVGIVLVAELCAQQRLFGPNACKERRDNQRGDDRQVCHIYECFQDSAAVMTHLESFGANFAARFMEVLKPTRLVVYGTPSAQVKDALAGLSPVYMAPLRGFRR